MATTTATATAIQVELKNVKIAQQLSEETTAFTATVHVNGKRTAIAKNHGHGGSNVYDILDRDRWDALEAHVETLPPLPNEFLPNGLPMSVDLFVEELLLQWEQDVQLKRWCRKDLVYRLKGDEKGRWRLMPHRNDVVAAIEYIKNERGEKLEEIANERFS